MLLRTPIVMLSSTISELSDVRDAVSTTVESAGLATAWRFEVHAASAGAPSDEQYLGIARTCDLYVVIVAAQQSEATEAEYRAAYEDNPEKVLAFFLGEGSAEVEEFKTQLETRHTRITRQGLESLVPEIGRSIQEYLESGKIIRRHLLEDIDRRIERPRTLVTDLPMLLEPRIRSDEQEGYARDLISREARIVLTGIGGAGKSLCAATTARRLSSDRRMLPMFLPVSFGATDLGQMIVGKLTSVRFEASEQLLHRWAAEGRLTIVVDRGRSACRR